MSVVGSAHLCQGYPKMRGDMTSREYTLKYQVRVSDPMDGTNTVLGASGLPSMFGSYTFGSFTDDEAKLRDYSVDRIQEDDKYYWVCTFDYSTPKDKGGVDRGGGKGTNQDPSDINDPLTEK